MLARTEEMILNEDIKNLYIGNLNTVEFDLNLPTHGKNGSEIRWESENELFLKPDGTVTRPWHGIGDRKVKLYAHFSYGSAKKEMVYDVHILEEPDQIEVEEVLPLTRNVKAGELFQLPKAVVVKSKEGRFYSRHVDWEEGNVQLFSECGNFVRRGSIENSIAEAILFVRVMKEYSVPRNGFSEKIQYMNPGETVLAKTGWFYQALNDDCNYLKSLNTDQLLYNFRVAAGIDVHGAQQMSGWDAPECMLRGHTTGHYLSALALCYRETNDEEILQRINYMIDSLAECQQIFSESPGFHKGYLGAYSEDQFDQLEQGVPYPQIWAPYYTVHKLLAGFLDCYQYAKSQNALHIACDLGRWVYERLSRLSSEKREAMWDTYIAGEYGGINESFAKLYELTGKKCFLDTARMFDKDRLFIPMEEKKDTLEGMHANQHIPQIVGCMEMYRATGEDRYYEISDFFWKAVTEKHIYVNGGTGENEMFAEPNVIGSRVTRETTEYCASYNMLKLTKELFAYRPEASYMDYYERVMFNHMIPGFYGGAEGKTAYFYPLAPGSVNDILFENACCHGTGMESQMKYTEVIFAHTQKEFYINLFLNADTIWQEKGMRIRMRVGLAHPEKVYINVNGIGEEATLKIRHPYWCEGEPSILVNNGKFIAKTDNDGYINIQRQWNDDEIVLEFSIRLRVEATPDKSEIAALAYGPYILATVSAQEDYLEFNPEKDLLSMKLIEKDIPVFQGFTSDRMWIPLASVKKERHHVYWKIKR